MIDPKYVDGEVDEHLLCSICTLILKQPTSGCPQGHSFCAECYKEAFVHTPKCPTCRHPTELGLLVRNRPLEGMINNLNARCPHSTDDSENQHQAKRQRRSDIRTLKASELKSRLAELGMDTSGLKADLVARLSSALSAADAHSVQCTWSGKLEQLGTHMSKDCPNVVIECPNTDCEAKIERCRMEKHATALCPYRLVACEHIGCGERVSFASMDVHVRSCPHALSLCTCGATVKLKDISAHSTICPDELISCPCFGCGHKVLRKNLDGHMVSFAISHASAANRELLNLRREIDEQKKSATTKASAMKRELMALRAQMDQQQLCHKQELAQLVKQSNLISGAFVLDSRKLQHTSQKYMFGGGFLCKFDFSMKDRLDGWLRFEVEKGFSFSCEFYGKAALVEPNLHTPVREFVFGSAETFLQLPHERVRQGCNDWSWSFRKRFTLTEDERKQLKKELYVHAVIHMKMVWT